MCACVCVCDTETEKMIHILCDKYKLLKEKYSNA